jgi:hypothetical protein
MKKRQSSRSKAVRIMKTVFSFFTVLVLLFSGCELINDSYGQLGGADQTQTYRPDEESGEGEDIEGVFEIIMSSMSGVWYSYSAGIGRLDGYRIGRWEDFDDLVETSGKIDLFPECKIPYAVHTEESGSYTPLEGDYFVFYDDTVYGQSDSGVGGNGGWEELVTRYIGIVRAVNVFNGDPKRGAIIIEYLSGCAPIWDDDLKNGSHPFFGIYYRVKDKDTVQMANAVDLAALYNGKKYYTETAHLDEAIKKNNIENEAEFISWGVVAPQKRN